MTRYDVAIIGAGVVGLCIAKELSNYKLDIICIEKEHQLGLGASGNNSGVIHSGINLKPGSLKARFCVEGNNMMYKLCEKLNVPYKKTGTLVVALNDEETNVLHELKRRADLNGVQGVKLLTKDEAKSIEPYVRAEDGLYSPTGGITLPKVLCQELANYALKNNVQFSYDTKVSGIEHDMQFRLKTSRGEFDSNVVINSAGLYADEIAAMIGFDKFPIHPWLGEYYIIDKAKGHMVNSMVYPAPQLGGSGLGIHLTKSLEGYILVGPNATKMDTKDHKFRSTANDFYNAIVKFLPEISISDLKYGYSGVRARVGSQSLLDADFVIDEYPTNFIHLIGIESPGLTSSPAIAKHVLGIVEERMALKLK